MKSLDLTLPLAALDPSLLSYKEWCEVGMALQHEGYSVAVWDEWSRRDAPRYHPGECEKKWETFRGNAAPVTGGTLVQLAKEHGWLPYGPGRELDWNDSIEQDDDTIIDRRWVEDREVSEPAAWDPARQLIDYLSAVFESDDIVGYVTESYEHDGRFSPTRGDWSRTAGQLIQELSHCDGDIGRVIGDWNETAGAWIRFNPLDGKGCRNENVTDFRYALVESDHTDLPRQNAILRELHLPIAALVHSGGKSLHAIVHIDAGSYSEYRERVNRLYTVCKKNGLLIDQQNCNPSRLSRMPGVTRAGKKQFLLDTNIGCANWAEWTDWLEQETDDLPDEEDELFAGLPPLADPLIDGVLRKGHKLLLAGPSKAGKSFALIELCICIAEGMRWLGHFPCAQGKVMYVNLELDRASCLHRFADVRRALGCTSHHPVKIWNLRGKSIPMDKLAPRLIRRAKKDNYIAIVIDPIYKVITGDENSADQMAAFCNQFDKVCTELGCAVIYCHHHSKGSQGQKRSMDRASGSGVFARDPDALLDLIQLDVPEDTRKQAEYSAVCAVCTDYLTRWNKLEDIPQDDRVVGSKMLRACQDSLPNAAYERVKEAIADARAKLRSRTAWRIEGTLREFPAFPPVDLWFDYPVHKADASGILSDLQPEADAPTYVRNFAKKRSTVQRQKDQNTAFETAFDACSEDGKATLDSLAEYMGTSKKTARRHAEKHGKFSVENGVVSQLGQGQTR